MIDIDLTGVGPTDSYSEETLEKAAEVLRAGGAKSLGDGVYLVTSTRSRFQQYYAAVSKDEGGTVIGVTCTCANGRKGGLRARCYHAAAAEHLAGSGVLKGHWNG